MTLSLEHWNALLELARANREVAHTAVCLTRTEAKDLGIKHEPMGREDGKKPVRVAPDFLIEKLYDYAVAQTADQKANAAYYPKRPPMRGMNREDHYKC